MKIKNIKNLVSLDIDAQAVRMIVGDVVKDGISVKKAGTSILPEGTFSDGKVLNQDVLERAIKNLLKNSKIKTTECYCTIESSQMISREVIIPNSPNANFQELAAFEMAQFLPVELKNYIVQSKKARDLEVEGRPFIEALATAVPKAMVDQMYQLLSNAGLRPLVLDTHGNAISKLFNIQNRVNDQYIGEKTIAFIEFGFESLYVSIFSKGQFKFSRMVSKGSRDLDSTMSKLLDIPLEDAGKKRLQIHNLMDASDEVTDENRIINVLRSSLEGWFDDIDKTFRYFQSRNKTFEAIDMAYIYGDTANIKGMPEFFQSYFRLPTEQIVKINKVEIPANLDGFHVSNYFYALGAMYRK